MAVSCRCDVSERGDRALLLLAGGLERAAFVVLQAEQLSFTEAGLASTGSGSDETLWITLVHELTSRWLG